MVPLINFGVETCPNLCKNETNWRYLSNCFNWRRQFSVAFRSFQLKHTNLSHFKGFFSSPNGQSLFYAFYWFNFPGSVQICKCTPVIWRAKQLIEAERRKKLQEWIESASERKLQCYFCLGIVHRFKYTCNLWGWILHSYADTHLLSILLYHVIVSPFLLLTFRLRNVFYVRTERNWPVK